MQLGRTDNYVLDFFMGIPAIWQGFLIMCAEHGTNLTGASPVTGIYRQV